MFSLPHIPGTVLLKALEFPGEREREREREREKENVFCYVNEVTFGKPLGHLRVGAGCQEKQPCDWRVGTFSPTPWVNDLVNHAYVMKPP